MAGYSFFGLQVLVRTTSRDPRRRALHDLLAAARAQSLQHKRIFWQRLSGILAETTPTFERGHWDLIRGGKAQAEFDVWSAEIEGAVANAGEERIPAPAHGHRPWAERQHLLLTAMFLVAEGSNADLTLGERCDLPEAEWLDRSTFARLLATAPLLNFANVQSDAAYLVPGSAEHALSDDDILDGGYSHLKPLR